MTIASAGPALYSSPAKTAYVLARSVEFVATAVFFGGLAFLGSLWPAGATVLRVRLFLGWVWLFGFLSTLAALVFGGVWAQGRPVGDSVQNPILRATLDTAFGREWTGGVLLWLLALVPLAAIGHNGDKVVRALPWRLATAAIGLGALRVTDLASHAKSTSTPVLTQCADIVHLAAMTIWLGGLAMLVVGVLPRHDPQELSRVVPRYSTLAMVSVGAVVVSGAAMAWQLLGPFGNLTSTTYGHLLLLKVALLAVIGVAAFFSKTWVGHRLDYAVVLRRESNMVRPFIVSVAAETALVITVLAVVSLLVTADPGR